MAFSQQPPYQQHRQEQPPNLIKSNYGNTDYKIPHPAAFLNLSALPDETHHPPYIPPPFQVMSLEPAPVEQLGGGGGGGGGLSLQWNYGFEPKKELPKEQDFLEDRSNNYARSNSQMSSVDLLQARTVSTGLGLSLANNYSTGRLAFSGDFISPVADELNRELQRHDDDVSNYLKMQGENLKQLLLEKFQANQIKTLSCVEERVQQKLREKETEVETFKQKNSELEMRMEKLALEAAACQQRAQYNETMINNLKFKLHMALAQNRDEGCGDSEVDDSASCCNGRPLDFPMFPNDGIGMKECMSCKVCRVNKLCILVLPCKHLCLCKECDSKLSSCPLCHTPKYIGLEVYM